MRNEKTIHYKDIGLFKCVCNIEAKLNDTKLTIFRND